jgi:tetrahydromethanopterin S-methyltransferase subunit A
MRKSDYDREIESEGHAALCIVTCAGIILVIAGAALIGTSKTDEVSIGLLVGGIIASCSYCFVYCCIKVTDWNIKRSFKKRSSKTSCEFVVPLVADSTTIQC